MSLDLLQVVLVQTRFPENIGMAARACVNMGSHSIRLVAPERWDREKARPLATPKGQGVLDDVQVLPDVSAAVADCSLVIGTTARTGGWRRSLLSPEQAAGEVAQALERGEKVAIVFGPEDRGLDNDAIQHCQRLMTIPTNPEASSSRHSSHTGLKANTSPNATAQPVASPVPAMCSLSCHLMSARAQSTVVTTDAKMMFVRYQGRLNHHISTRQQA